MKNLVTKKMKQDMEKIGEAMTLESENYRLKNQIENMSEEFINSRFRWAMASAFTLLMGLLIGFAIGRAI